MARVLLAPVLDEDRFRGADRVAGHGEARESTADQAAVGRRSGRSRARVAPAGRWRATAEDVVVGIEHVHVRAVPGSAGQARVKGEPEQAPIPEVVDVGRQATERRRRRIGQVVEDLDGAALLGDEDAAVGGEPDGHRVHEAGPDGRLLEARRDDGLRLEVTRRGEGRAFGDLRGRLALEQALLALLGLWLGLRFGRADRGRVGCRKQQADKCSDRDNDDER